MTTAFDDVRLPEDIEQGALVGPQFSTSIVSMSGGKEQRNSEWEQERLRANIAYGVMQKADPFDIEDSFQRIMRFFRARRGQWRGFRFKDFSDFEAEQINLTPDETGKKYQLVKNYEDYQRIITRPVEGSLIVYLGGVIVPPGPDTWQLGPLGVITTKTANVAVMADFEFDVPMRFDTDMAQVAMQFLNAGSISNIDLIQVRE